MRFEEAPVTVHYTEYSLAKGQKMRDAVKVSTDILYAKLDPLRLRANSRHLDNPGSS